MAKKSRSNKTKLVFLQKLSLFFFNRPRKTAILWLVVAVFGFASYSTLLKREGFPAVQTPFAIANGTYLANDPAKVDQDVAKPVSEYILSQSGIKSVAAASQANFYSIAIGFEEDVDARAKSSELKEGIKHSKMLPANATFALEPFKFGFTERGDDLTVSLHKKNQDASTAELTKKAKELAEFFRAKNISEVEAVSVLNPFESALNPQTGKTELAQKTFDRYGKRDGKENKFYNSVVIGFFARGGSDNIELDNKVQSAIDEALSKPEFSGFSVAISASYAPEIKAQVNELQQVLLEALAAILIVGSVIIAIRASIITVVSLLSVLAATLGILYLLGYTLNTITLFSLILGLALIIDDIIIMVEALDAQRKRQKKAAQAVAVATKKVSRAMIAATFTAVLSFTPLIFVSGILGEFIRAIPITIIAALIISLLAALVFIPLFARFILLKKGQVGSNYVGSFTAGIEHHIAEIIARPMLAARKSKSKLAGVSVAAIIFSFIFIGASGYFFQKITFDIFPSAKDTNKLAATISYPENTNLKTAEKIAGGADKIIANKTGENLRQASYYGQANVHRAVLTIDITDYKERDIKSPELVSQLQAEFEDFAGANVQVAQIDAGPPPAEFSVRINSGKDRAEALELSNNIASFLANVKLERIDGSIAEVKSASAANSDVYNRADGKPYVAVTANFTDNDTTTLVTLAQKAVEKEFDAQRLNAYGLSPSDISFDFGQESENQESFKTLAIAFPLVLLAIYILLAFQFRSLIQPILIFMAIPFSLLGITLGLYLTDNAFSFFAMLGFFALIGLSIKNTILLTDFANQSRKAGLDPIDSIHGALAERFRPLVATSLTAIVSLIPLYLTSPFWESLTVVLIFGLLSSTLLVIVAFPYYYLAGEFARSLGQKAYRKLARNR